MKALFKNYKQDMFNIGKNIYSNLPEKARSGIKGVWDTEYNFRNDVLGSVSTLDKIIHTIKDIGWNIYDKILNLKEHKNISRFLKSNKYTATIGDIFEHLGFGKYDKKKLSKYNKYCGGNKIMIGQGSWFDWLKYINKGVNIGTSLIGSLTGTTLFKPLEYGSKANEYLIDEIERQKAEIEKNSIYNQVIPQIKPNLGLDISETALQAHLDKNKNSIKNVEKVKMTKEQYKENYVKKHIKGKGKVGKNKKKIIK